MAALGLWALVLLLLLGSCFSFRSTGRLSVRRRHRLPTLGLGQNKEGGEDLDGLRVDESRLSSEERERLAFIQKLSNEADDMIRKAGFRIDGEQDAEEIERAVKDTKWSGQSDVEKTLASSNNYDDLKNRLGLAIVDFLAILTFAFVGRSNHGEELDLLAVFATALPFVAAWFALSPFTGAYSRQATSSKGGVPKGLALGWGVAMPLALGIRGLTKGAIPPTPFIIVSLAATFVLLSAYRFVYVFLVGATSDEETKSAGALEVFKMVGSLIKRW